VIEIEGTSGQQCLVKIVYIIYIVNLNTTDNEIAHEDPIPVWSEL